MSGVSTGQPSDTGSSKSIMEMSTEELDKLWISTSDPKELSEISSRFSLDLEKKRKEPSKYSVNITIRYSIIVFSVIMLVLMLVPIDERFTNLFQGLGNQGPDQFAGKIQFSIIMSASGGLIPGISYAIFRDREKESKNEELEALSLKIRNIRSRVISLKEAKAAETLK